MLVGKVLLEYSTPLGSFIAIIIRPITSYTTVMKPAQ